MSLFEAALFNPVKITNRVFYNVSYLQTNYYCTFEMDKLFDTNYLSPKV